MNDAETMEEVRLAIDDMSGFLQVAGCNIPVRALADKNRIIQASLQFYLLDRVRSCMDRYFRTYDKIDAITLYNKDKQIR